MFAFQTIFNPLKDLRFGHVLIQDRSDRKAIRIQ